MILQLQGFQQRVVAEVDARKVGILLGSVVTTVGGKGGQQFVCRQVETLQGIVGEGEHPQAVTLRQVDGFELRASDANLMGGIQARDIHGFQFVAAGCSEIPDAVAVNFNDTFSKRRSLDVATGDLAVLMEERVGFDYFFFRIFANESILNYNLCDEYYSSRSS